MALEELAMIAIPFFEGFFLFALPGGIFMLVTIRRPSAKDPARL